MRMDMRAWAGIGLLAAVISLGSSGRVEAYTFQVLGAGARSSAMLAGTASARGPASLYYNPGGMTLCGETEILAGFQITSLDLEINGRDIDEEEIAATYFGFTHPLEVFGLKMGIGALISLPLQRLSRFLTLPLDQPQYLYFGTRNQRMVIMAGGALQVTPWLSVGAGVQTLLTTFSEPDFSLVQDPDSGNDFTDPEADSLEAQSFGFATAVNEPVLAPVVGIRILPFEGLTLGVTYRAELESRISAPFEVTIEEINLFGLTLAQSRFVLPNDATVFFSPHEVSVGSVYVTPDDRWTVSLDVTWFDWSRFPPTFSAATPEFTGGLAELILPVPAFLPVKPPTRDTFVPAAGLEWQALGGDHVDLRLRAGYTYRPSILKEDTSLSNYLDTNTHIVGAGFGFRFRDWCRFLPEPLSVEAYVQTHILEDRDVVKADPASSPFGDLQLSGMLLGGGLEVTLRF